MKTPLLIWDGKKWVKWKSIKEKVKQMLKEREMRKITIALAPVSKQIFAGHLNKKETMWIEKQNVTLQVLQSVAEYCEKHGDTLISDQHGQPMYSIKVEKIKGEG